MNNKIVGNLIYYLLEVIYLALMIVMMVILKINYLDTNYYGDLLFVNSLILIIVLLVLFGPYLGKLSSAICACFCIVSITVCENYFNYFQEYPLITRVRDIFDLYSYADKKLVNITIAILLIFLIITVTINILNKTEIIYKKYRVIIVLLFIVVGYNMSNYHDGINALYNSKEYFQKNETEYYIYYNDNSKLFRDSFGTYSYLYKSLKKPATLRNETEVKNFIYSNNFNKNYTTSSVFSEKSVLFIQINNLYFQFINEDIMPTLNHMKNNGIYVNGFSNPFLKGGVGDTEFMTNLSMIPNTEEIAYYRYADNTYGTTLADIFNDAGYYTEVYLNGFSVYYNRDKMFSIYGYDDVLDKTRLENDDDLTNEEMVEKLKWIMSLSEVKRMGYWITDTSYCDEYQNSDIEKMIYEKHPDIEHRMLKQIAANICFDNSIKELISFLTKQDRINDYVFVIFGSGDNNISKEDFNYENESDSNGLIIYSGESNYQLSINKTSSYIDILPTIADLFGFSYNRSNVFGRDILENEYNGFLFDGEHTISNDYFDYDFYNRKLSIKEECDRGFIDKEIAHYLEMLKIMGSAIKMNYFGK